MELIFSAQSANKEVISFIDPFCGEMVLKTIGRDQLAYISTVSFAWNNFWYISASNLIEYLWGQFISFLLKAFKYHQFEGQLSF